MSRYIPRRFEGPPIKALKRLEAAALADFATARVTLGLFNAILGISDRTLFPEDKWKISDLQSLPLKARRAAQATLEWGARRRLIVNELVRAQAAITEAVWKMRRESPLGRRCTRIAKELRKKHPPLEPDGRPRPSNLQSLEVLEEEWGRPLGTGTILRLRALGASQIEIRKYQEPFYAAWAERAAYVDLSPDGYTIQRIKIDVACERSPPTKVIFGVLEDFFETGTEGVVWSVYDEDERGYDGLHPIDEGDHLTILDELGHQIWAGTIRCDRKTGWRPFPLNPNDGQPCALGHRVHWTQRGFKPDDWARFFIRYGRPRLKGILRKKRR